MKCYRPQMKKKENISIIGAGRWGSFQAWYQAYLGNTALLYAPKTSKTFKQLIQTRQNDYLKLPNAISFTNDLKKALEPNIIFIAIPAQKVRTLCQEIHKTGIELNQKIFVLCMKGLETNTGKRLTEVVNEELPNTQTAVFVGPGHVQSITQNEPTCMVVDSNSEETKDKIANLLNSNLIRTYKGCDLIGTEIGAATKNIMGLAAGILDGLGFSATKGALMARGTYEVSQLIEAAGGDKMSAYGLAHLGDYEATLFSKYSHNRLYGESFITGKTMTKHAEGIETLKATLKLGKRLNIELPICEALSDVLLKKKAPKEAFLNIFNRPTKDEF